MYDDTQSIEVFRRIHAREVLTDQARNGRSESQSIVDAHAASGRLAAWLLMFVGLALVALGLAIAIHLI